MKKKIIFFIPNADDGGIEKNLIILSNFFSNKNYKVEIIHSRITKNIAKKLNTNISLIKTDIIFNLSILSSRINNSINCFLYSLLKINFSKKTTLFSMQDHPFSIILSLLKRIPCLIRIANHPVGSLKYFNNFLIYKLKLLIKIFFYNFATLIVCNSKQSTSFFKESLWRSKKILTIYNPIKIIKKKEKIFKRNKYKLLTVGRLENQKNLFGLLKAFSIILKENKKFSLTIVGKGSEKKKLVNYAKNLKIHNFIKFINFSDPKKFYKKNGIFILNSFFEGLPNVLIEAMQYKIPIISTDCKSGPREILKNETYGHLIKINDPDGLAKKINYVVSNYKKALKKTNYGFKSLGRFEIDKQCQKYENLVSKL